MAIVSFGEYKNDSPYKVLDERVMRGSAGLMLSVGVFAVINMYFEGNWYMLPYISGFLMLNFMIGIFINPKFSPTVAVASLLTRKQMPLYVGAVQKRFAWSLGLALVTAVFVLSILYLNDIGSCYVICTLCLTCLFLMFLETSFGICLGCKLYPLAIRLGLMKEPDVRPNCAGDACTV